MICAVHMEYKTELHSNGQIFEVDMSFLNAMQVTKFNHNNITVSMGRHSKSPRKRCCNGWGAVFYIFGPTNN